jgi:hypothetical protein
MRNPRLTITPREAAALDRLLDAYVGNEDADPGMDDLRTLRAKLNGIEQDHALYDAAFSPTRPKPSRCPGSIVMGPTGPPAFCGSTRAHAAHDLTEGDTAPSLSSDGAP